MLYVVCLEGLGSDDEVRLVDHLFDGYNPLIRPVRNLTDVIDVGFNLALIQLINVVCISYSPSARVTSHCASHLPSMPTHLTSNKFSAPIANRPVYIAVLPVAVSLRRSGGLAPSGGLGAESLVGVRWAKSH